MRKLQRIVIATMAGVIMLSSFGCSKSISYPKGTPTLSDEKNMIIGAYHAPLLYNKESFSLLTDAQKPKGVENYYEMNDYTYKQVAEAGITHLMLNQTNDEYNGTGEGYEKEKGYDLTDERYWSSSFEHAKNNGLNIIMHLRGKPHSALSDYYNDIMSNDNFAGVLAVDEPPASQFDAYADLNKHYKTVFSGYPYYINLLPDYATEKQLGVKHDEGKTNAWEKYVDQYTEKVLSKYDDNYKVMLCDCYPLMGATSNSTTTYNKWLYNLEYLRKSTDSVGGELQMFLQAQGFLNKWRQPMLTAEITYQMYVYMAYGCTGMHYYPYKTPKASQYNAIVDKQGVKYEPIYNIVKEANEELKRFDGIYLGFNWKAVVAKAGDYNPDGTNINFEYCSDLKDNYGILERLVCDEDAIVGCFENEEGYQGFMAVNFDQPKSRKENKITLKFSGDVDEAIVYVKGIPETVSLTNGELVKTLKAGEGIFVVPYKAS